MQAVINKLNISEKLEYLLADVDTPANAPNMLLAKARHPRNISSDDVPINLLSVISINPVSTFIICAVTKILPSRVSEPSAANIYAAPVISPIFLISLSLTLPER